MISSKGKPLSKDTVDWGDRELYRTAAGDVLYDLGCGWEHTSVNSSSL